MFQRGEPQHTVWLSIPFPPTIPTILFRCASPENPLHLPQCLRRLSVYQWPRWKKNTLLFIVSIFSFLANGALFGPSVYTNYLAEQFQKTTNEISHLVTYPNLLFGFGEMPFSGITSPYVAANDVNTSTQGLSSRYPCTTRSGGVRSCWSQFSW